MTRVLLALSLAAATAAVPVAPLALAGASPGWTSEACGSSGTACAFPETLGNQVNLNAISCPSVGRCVAVGDFVNSESNGQPPCPVSTDQRNGGFAACSLPLVETLAGGVWTATTPAYPKAIPGQGGSGYMTGGLTGVSCVSVTSCVAVGYKKRH